MTTEAVDRRILGAVRFVDAVTRRRVDSALHVRADRASFLRNRSGDYIITTSVGLETQTTSFDRPSAMPVVDPPVTITVQDPQNRYLARQCTVSLPLDADPDHEGDGTSVFAPIEVALYPTPAAPTWPGWAVIRATVRPPAAPGATGDEVLANALLRVVRVSDNALLGSGMSDARGEALVAVAGIPITTFGAGAGPVLETSVAVVIQVIVDPNATVPNPDDLEKRRAALLVKTSPGLVLASGQTVTRTV